MEPEYRVTGPKDPRSENPLDSCKMVLSGPIKVGRRKKANSMNSPLSRCLHQPGVCKKVELSLPK
jgi:hypothetical protein